MIKEISSIASASPKVKDVVLGGCKELVHLPKLKNVEILYLDGCCPEVISVLPYLTKLKELWIDESLGLQVRPSLPETVIIHAVSNNFIPKPILQPHLDRDT